MIAKSSEAFLCAFAPVRRNFVGGSAASPYRPNQFGCNPPEVI